ncbi:MAG TPA: hypothetical protein VF529_21755 [Solirubrobacteraceae bacterium]|jgi:hypothetical protein
MAVSFQNDIVKLFTNDDIDHMKDKTQVDPPVYLAEYSYMSDSAGDDTYPDHANANNVYYQLSNGLMPLDDNDNPVPWPSDQVALFKSWMDDGYQP